MVYIVGCVHPKALHEGYVGPKLTKARMEKTAKGLTGRPILDTHKPGTSVGKVIRSWVDGEDQMYMVGVLDENSPMARVIAERIKNKQYVGLSLGMMHRVVPKESGIKVSCANREEDPEWDDVEWVIESHISEVSVCKKGKYPNTVLYTYFSQDLPEETQEALRNVHQLEALETNGEPSDLFSFDIPKPAYVSEFRFPITVQEILPGVSSSEEEKKMGNQNNYKKNKKLLSGADGTSDLLGSSSYHYFEKNKKRTAQTHKSPIFGNFSFSNNFSLFSSARNNSLQKGDKQRNTNKEEGVFFPLFFYFFC